MCALPLIKCNLTQRREIIISSPSSYWGHPGSNPRHEINDSECFVLVFLGTPRKLLNRAHDNLFPHPFGLIEVESAMLTPQCVVFADNSHVY
jgi:hypothetical protein